jgi:photosystem II stability/assembly factor-like uncharacterized protein
MRLKSFFAPLVVVLLSLLLANPSHAWWWKRPENLSTIAAPKRLEKLDSHPVVIVVHFHKGAKPATFQAWLNRKNITDKFRAIENGKVAYVYPEDGLRVRADGKHSCKPKVNILKTKIKGKWRKLDVDVRTFFVREKEEEEFFEEVPGWRMPDLAVTDLTVSPDMADPGDEITFSATVTNLGVGTASTAELRFLVDDVEIVRKPVEPLAPGAGVELTANWAASGPGRHEVAAELEFMGRAFDPSFENNLQARAVRISGEADPQPELEFGEIDFDALQLTPGESATIPVKVRNPSFAAIGSIPVDFYIDGERVCGGGIDIESAPPENTDIYRSDIIEPPTIVPCDWIQELAPGAEDELHVPWDQVTEGQHMISVVMYPGWMEGFEDAFEQFVKTWTVKIPGKTVLYDTPQKHKWASIGPRLIQPSYPDSSVGRIDAIAFHPNDSKIIYAGAPTGGIWKTTNGGASWTPLGDKLPAMNISALAVDPKHPEIVYAATGSQIWRGGFGIFKSIDGGNNWYHFATKEVAEGVKRNNGLVIRYLPNEEVMIYAATNFGIKRYQSNNPWATVSFPYQWQLIKDGVPVDMAVNPEDDSRVYVSVGKWVVRTVDGEKRNVFVLDSLYRTDKGATTMGAAGDWDELTTGLPTLKDGSSSVFLDIYRGFPSYVYLAVANPPGGKDMVEIYRSTNDGDNWDFVGAGKLHRYNDFIRVHPTDFRMVLYGGVKLTSLYLGFNYETVVTDIHDDMKALEFDPFNIDYYYILNDGGVWRCSAWSHMCVHKNNELRVTQFYDFDVSQTNKDLMLGGTQDNGNILYEGDDIWRGLTIFNYGDGYYSLIGPESNDQIMYAQFQSLDSTARSEDGGQTWQKANNGLPDDLTMDAGNITVHPDDPYYLLSRSHVTTDGGDQWKLLPVGTIEKIVFQPGTFYWLAGTSDGQIWYSKDEGKKWTSLYGHPHKQNVVSMAFAPTNSNVLYVLFKAPSDKRHTRIMRMVLDMDSPNPSADSTFTYIGQGFPLREEFTELKVICGDGYSDNVAYVGTNHGVYRWVGAETIPPWNRWQPYNDGFPFVDVRDLLVQPSSKELRAATFGRGAWSVITGP